jgi:hypothetical protein
MGKLFGILAVICGILGFIGWLLLGLLPYGAYYLPGAAIGLGIIGLIVDDPKGMAIAGIILGVIGIVFVIFILPLLAGLLILWGLSALLGGLT